MGNKKWIKPFAAAAIAGALLIGGWSWSAGGTALAQEAAAMQNFISVTGKGEIAVKPDIAYLSIGASSEADTAAAAQKANAAKIQKINTLLKNTWKVDSKDIQTNQFYVQPNYTYSEKDGQKIKGYTAYHTLKVSYRNLEKVGELLDAATNAGANQIDNVVFSIEDTEAFETQVIDKAMANAKLKAGAIANAAKRQLGIVLSVSQGSLDEPITYYRESLELQSTSKAEDSANTAIESGEIKLTTQLTVRYELK